MAQIGDISTSFLSGTQELYATLANFKLDFSLIKLEAPTEYLGLGQSLSKKRKLDAEEGSSHVTARKLGALFEDIIPDTPHLYEVYGRRVTEIAEIPHLNPRGTSADGPFADHVGADGTTIWAAATSGRSAIAMHLLACFLARMWKAPEAISIWTEIIAYKKENLKEKCSGEVFEVSALMASQIILSRDQIAEWDASARAWLRTADEAKINQQTKAMLILKNVNLPVYQHKNVYTSVVTAWSKAMTMHNLLIQGMPQRVQDGGVLLGLSSWHIYPDIYALGAESKFLSQKDLLVKTGGIVTIGLLHEDPIVDDGVYWSLPLAHMMYYGDPITRTATSGPQSSRISMDEMSLVALGSVLSTWGNLSPHIERTVEAIDAVVGTLDVDSYEKIPWIVPIMKACHIFRKSAKEEREHLSRLLQFGIRRCPLFIANPSQHPPPMFGLTDMHFILGLHKDIDSKIRCLRKAAESFGLANHDGAIIRYFRSQNDRPHFTSLIPRRHRGAKGKRVRAVENADECLDNDYSYWIGTGRFDSPFLNYASHRNITRAIENGIPFNYSEEMPLAPTLAGRDGVVVECKFVYGDPFYAAVFLPLTDRATPKTAYNNTTATALPELLSMTGLQREKLELRLTEVSNHHSDFCQSLDGLASALDIYTRIPTASVSMRVSTRTINQWTWCQDYFHARKHGIATAFACIASFETGDINLKTQDLKGAGIMALSYDNSIFVAEQIFSDPCDALPPFAIRRIIGNIGKPGLSLLVPPRELKHPKPDFESWSLVNHNPFNGAMEDNFGGTSLHLSFSEYQLAVDTGIHGQRDQEAYFIEAIVSVHDRGRWVADVDILKSSKVWLEEPMLKASSQALAVSQRLELEETFWKTSSPSLCSIDVTKLPELWRDDELDFDQMLVDQDNNFSEYEELVDGREDNSSSDQGADEEESNRSKLLQERIIGSDTGLCKHLGESKTDLTRLHPLASIDSWAELLDPPTNNGIVRAHANKIARLCIAAVAVQQGFNVHIAKDGICWQCEYVHCQSEESHNANIAALNKESDVGETSDEGLKPRKYHLFIC